MSPAPVTFCLRPGRRIGGRYSVVSKLGSGWEGEVYRVIEDRTGVERAAKLFYPQRNPKSKAALHYARKLDRLRHCSVMIQYHHWERITVRERDVDAVISEVVDGIRLSSFLRQQSGGRMRAFEALHLMHSLTRSMEAVHALGEYHGDLHSDNVLINRQGLGFKIRTIDVLDLGRPSRNKIQQDVVEMVHLLHEILGGRRFYADQHPAVKKIIKGLKATLIRQQFRNAGDLRLAIEHLIW